MTLGWTFGVQKIWKSHSEFGSVAAGLRLCRAAELGTSSENGIRIPFQAAELVQFS